MATCDAECCDQRRHILGCSFDAIVVRRPAVAMSAQVERNTSMRIAQADANEIPGVRSQRATVEEYDGLAASAPVEITQAHAVWRAALASHGIGGIDEVDAAAARERGECDGDGPILALAHAGPRPSRSRLRPPRSRRWPSSRCRAGIRCPSLRLLPFPTARSPTADRCACRSAATTRS